MIVYTGPQNETVASNGEPGANEFVQLYAARCLQDRADEANWIVGLRQRGIKAAHPDDGWVNRTNNSVTLTYPQFDDGIAVGDLIALGAPEKWREVRVTATAYSHTPHWTSYCFEETP